MEANEDVFVESNMDMFKPVNWNESRGADQGTPEENNNEDQGRSLRKFIPLPMRSANGLGKGARLALITAGLVMIPAGIAIAIMLSQGNSQSGTATFGVRPLAQSQNNLPSSELTVAGASSSRSGGRRAGHGAVAPAAGAAQGGSARGASAHAAPGKSAVSGASSGSPNPGTSRPPRSSPSATNSSVPSDANPANPSTKPSPQATRSAPASTCGTLASNTALTTGQYILSCNGDYKLGMQGDGNFVLYHGSTALWASKTSGTAAVRAAMQSDGNLVVYTSSLSPLWDSATEGNPKAFLAVQNDGNLVIDSASGSVLWQTNT